MNEERIKNLLSKSESEILEFKLNNEDPERIGKYVSALANSSALLRKQFSYMIWGVTDEKVIFGTDFRPQAKKVGNEPFISWLEKLLDPRIMINFEEFEIDGLHVVALVIQMTVGRPVTFRGERYIRSGSSIKNLAGYPEKERELWRSFDARTFEKEFALTNCSSEEIFELLDVDTYMEMLNYPPTSDQEKVLSYMQEDFLIEASISNYNITNLGAYTFANDLSNFEKLRTRTIRVIKYRGNNKLVALADVETKQGVVVEFEDLLMIVRGLLPLSAEVYDPSGRRIHQTDYPALVIREAIANQIVHQDFSVIGSRPVVEIFDNRVEITNPGAPINEPNRLLDLPPVSRNEELANLFKKMHLVESRGSGIDKIVITLELENLPAPDILAKENNTVLTLFERKSLLEMNDKERLNAIYYHAARLFLENDYMTNQTVRTRFGLTDKQSPLVSKAIALAMQSGLIKPYNENAGNKFMQYIPFWGKSYNE